MASIQKRPDGVWRARYRDPAGREHAQHFKRKVDAQQWLDEATASMVVGLYVDPKAGKITFDDWFSLWSDLQVWEPGTMTAAGRAAKDLPFGSLPLNAITSLHVQAWVKALEARGLAASTIRMRFNYVHMAFRAAVGERVAKDPSSLSSGRNGPGVRLPKESRSSAREIPTSEQVRALYDAAAFHFRPFIATCAFAGLRLGEAAGLQLRDVVFLERRIHVQRQVQGQTTADVRQSDPKAKSDRWVPIPEELVLILSGHVHTTGVMGEEEWLFTPDAQHVYNRNSAGHQWRQACRAAGVTGFTLHSLRHFYASALIHGGCDVVTVQRALGHSSPEITLNTYSHLWPNADDRTRTAASDAARTVLADSLRTTGTKNASDKAGQR